jgi:hypothetical protein
MPDAGYKTGTATNRTRRVPVRRMPGQMKLTNAGTMSDKSTSRLYVCLLIKIAQNAGCQFGNRQSRTGPQGVPVTRMQGPKNLINAGIIERTPDNKSTSKLCVCRIIKMAQNAGCRFGNRHSHQPDPACAGYENAGSKKINKCRYY